MGLGVVEVYFKTKLGVELMALGVVGKYALLSRRPCLIGFIFNVAFLVDWGPLVNEDYILASKLDYELVLPCYIRSFLIANRYYRVDF